MACPIGGFFHEGVEFQVLHLPTERRLQVWYRWKDGGDWEFGHSKGVPTDMDPVSAAKIMESFVKGSIDHDVYNALLRY